MKWPIDYLRKRKIYLLWIVLTIYSGICLTYLFNLATGNNIATFSSLSISLFAILAALLVLPYKEWRSLERGKALKRRICYSLFFSYAVGLSFILGYQMRMLGSTSLGFRGKAFILLVSGGVGIAFVPIVNLWLRLLDGFKKQVSKQRESCKIKNFFLIYWLVILLCWIPVFLAYYPAIMSYDFHRQSQEAYKGYIWFNSHHPLVHTFLIKVFFGLGESLGSYQIGMALFSILQMLILSAVMAYSCQMMGRLLHKRWPSVAAVLLFALLPIHPVLALSMTKDILFSAFFLLFLLLMLELWMYQGGKAGRCLLYVAMTLTGVLVIMFRNNAVYAFVVFAIFYVFLSQRKKLQLTMLCVMVVVGGQGAKNLMQNAMQAGSGSKVEMYSLFIQQFGRVGHYHENSLEQEDYWLLDYYVSHKLWGQYNPPLADTIKGTVAQTSYLEWKNDIPAMLRDWVKFGLEYPNDYIDAFLALTSGYWFLDDVSHAEVLGYGDDTNLGLLYTFNASQSDTFEGVESHSYLPGLLKMYQRIVNGNCYFSWPVVSSLFKPALYCWALALVMISLVYMHCRRKLFLCLLPFFYLMTLFLGPVVNMRYAYPIIVAVPLLFAWLFDSHDIGDESSVQIKKEQEEK